MIAQTEKGNGFGLVGLRERFELLGGQVAYGQAEQGGFRISVRAPVLAGAPKAKEDLFPLEDLRNPRPDRQPLLLPRTRPLPLPRLSSRWPGTRST
ncbi:MAG: hypothetical protein H0U76_24815 [Ktedonobacteraceae bacterium]|nr:hypothetical protein [Ktedonobacteraceae bacterium]